MRTVAYKGITMNHTNTVCANHAEAMCMCSVFMMCNMHQMCMTSKKRYSIRAME